MRVGNFYGSTYALNEYKLEELEVNHDGAEVMYSAKYSNNIIRYNQSWNASAADRVLIYYYYEMKTFIVNNLLRKVSSYMSSDKHRTNLNLQRWMKIQRRLSFVRRRDCEQSCSHSPAREKT